MECLQPFMDHSPSVTRCAQCRRMRRDSAHSVPDPTPARALVAELTAARASGVEFGDAWTPALASVTESLKPEDAEGWRSAFAATRLEWWGAYAGYDQPMALNESLLDFESYDEARLRERID